MRPSQSIQSAQLHPTVRRDRPIEQGLAFHCQPEERAHPSARRGAPQVILLGEVLQDMESGTYFRDTTLLRRAAYAALDRLKARHEVLVLEGAGSCAEVNLRSRDFVNFDAAHAADADVLLVADIHKGGL